MEEMKKMTVIGAVALMASATPSFAQDTGSLDVTAEVLSSCNITSTSTLAFGTVDQAAANIDNQGRSAWSARPRRLGSPHRRRHQCRGRAEADEACVAGRHAQLRHLCRRRPVRAVPHRSGHARRRAPASDTGNGQLQIVTVFGRIPSGQTLPRPGNYSDTLTVTVSY
ncbi:spore coat protein U domain-containing protein [Ditylenchus destructor]|uniref:Spore coat protein U domain-containing protein n=1 Tax=Ditylenchus destructor TaxID=166010 RepID=A0AAD4MGA5_9BILA|nr:spore coat protein U domain-containing protein [Ditylenchus destructor]